MLVEVSLRLLRYKGKDTIAFYFNGRRKATINELQGLDATFSGVQQHVDEQCRN